MAALNHRAVFVTSNSILLWLHITALRDQLEKTHNSVIQLEVKSKPLVTVTQFCIIHVSYMYLLQVLIASLYCLCPV